MLQFDDPNKRAIIDYVIMAGWKDEGMGMCILCLSPRVQDG